MASRKGGKTDVSFGGEGEKAFTVNAKGQENAFDSLAEFQVFAKEAKLSAAAISSVEKAVVQHFVQLEEQQPLSQALGEHLQAEKGVAARLGEDSQYLVSLPYNPNIVKAMRDVPGARFDQAQKGWAVPIDSRTALQGALVAVDQVLGEMVTAKASVTDEVHGLAKEGQLPGVSPDAAIRVTGFHRSDWIYTGAIVAANAHFIAQLAEHEKENATIVLHRAADLPEQVFKGDKVALAYDSNGKVQVMTPEQAQAKFANLADERFKASLGKPVDGVNVSEAPEGMVVKMDYNPKAAAILYRMKKYGDDAVSFNKDLGGYLVSNDVLNQDGALDDFKRAIHSARREIREDKQARSEIEKLAQEKMTGAKVQFPQGKDGEFQSGKVIAVSDRYVLQAAGREFMKAHEVSKLAEVPAVGQTVTIRYGQGKATVQDRSQSQEKSASLSR